MSAAARKPRVLCVDDEPDLLEGLELHLRKKYRVKTATSGAAGLALLEEQGPFSIVLSDMRMPEMNGAAFLSQVRVASPDSVRLLLTGQTDMDSAISAINEGQIFRFLTKPCAPQHLIAAFEQAQAQHALITAERELLEKTLAGCIDALSDVLALTHPTAFGRATRIRVYAMELAEALALPHRWQVGVAAMFSQLGVVTLQPELVEKLFLGAALSPAEQQLADRVPEVAQRLVEKIPRLESVSQILQQQSLPFGDVSQREARSQAACILRVATDFEALETRGASVEVAMATLQGRHGVYAPEVIEAFAKIKGSSPEGAQQEVRELSLNELRPGMVFAEDVKTQTGTVFVARGYEITDRFIARVGNFDAGYLREPIRVSVSLGGN